ncbi:MAG: HAD family hydrolase [Humibacter sp.]
MFPNVEWDVDPAVHRRVFIAVLSRDGVVSTSFAAELYEAMPRQCMLNRGAGEFVDAARGCGVKLALISNTGLDVRTALHEWGIASLFDTVTLSFEVGLVKPDPRIFLHTAKALSVAPEQCVMIGDSPVEDGGASAAVCSA